MIKESKEIENDAEGVPGRLQRLREASKFGSAVKTRNPLRNNSSFLWAERSQQTTVPSKIRFPEKETTVFSGSSSISSYISCPCSMSSGIEHIQPYPPQDAQQRSLNANEEIDNLIPPSRVFHRGEPLKKCKLIHRCNTERKLVPPSQLFHLAGRSRDVEDVQGEQTIHSLFPLFSEAPVDNTLFIAHLNSMSYLPDDASFDSRSTRLSEATVWSNTAYSDSDSDSTVDWKQSETDSTQPIYLLKKFKDILKENVGFILKSEKRIEPLQHKESDGNSVEGLDRHIRRPFDNEESRDDILSPLDEGNDCLVTKKTYSWSNCRSLKSVSHDGSAKSYLSANNPFRRLRCSRVRSKNDCRHQSNNTSDDSTTLGESFDQIHLHYGYGLDGPSDNHSCNSCFTYHPRYKYYENHENGDPGNGEIIANGTSIRTPNYFLIPSDSSVSASQGFEMTPSTLTGGNISLNISAQPTLVQ